jgi:hypothetical protein
VQSAIPVGGTLSTLTNQTHMKKTLLALLALSLSAIAYAGSGCGGGGCDKDKAPTEKPAEKPEAPKS